ncbi:hypothetical protein D4Q80_03770 [bacterium]|nr:MAG: hypothetical protein D4Q80_03770 [bacterium]
MQGPTHLFAGILIQKSLQKIRPRILRYFLIVSLAIFVHVIFDNLSRVTYHPPEPILEDWFWVCDHLIMYGLALYILIKYWSRYWLGMLFSVLPDLDWFIKHAAKIFSFSNPVLEQGILHKNLRAAIDPTLPLSLLRRFPDLKFERIGALIEVGLLLVLASALIVWEKSEHA